MRLDKNKIDEVVFRILREDGLELINQLKGKSHISEFDLATKLKKDIKIVRRMLYFLYNKNLVSFIRKKDKQKGWYIYYWTLELNSIKHEFIKQKKETLERLKATLKKEEGAVFYVCSDNCVRLDMDESLEYDFHCPECGNLLEQDDSQEKIQRLHKRIKSLGEEIKVIEEQEAKKRQKIAQKAKKEREEEEARLAEELAQKEAEKLAEKERKKQAAKEKAEAKKRRAKEAAAKKKAIAERKKAAAAKKKIAEKKKKEAAKKKAAAKKKKEAAIKKKASKKKKATNKKASEKKKSTSKKKATTKKKVASNKKKEKKSVQKKLTSLTTKKKK